MIVTPGLASPMIEPHDSEERSVQHHREDAVLEEAVLDGLNRDWQRGQERALDLRFELREQLTREEWAALYSDE